MPPKGKKEKLKKKKKSIEEHEVFEPSEREIALRAKLENKVKQLAEIKMRVHTTEQENNWLTKEADRLQIEMREYTHFMSKKANLRQTQMITLGDYHRQEIEDINRDIKNMTKEYKQKKKGISAISSLMKGLIEFPCYKTESVEDIYQ
ncbi:unnamed protein product [Adineta steineri]|uniref:Uncharacterized protein n=1 Tax=Adineta steineri TaxID=433720 RepID=A0A818VKZ3_9BILA|nr:unnamed protein product [Adineta steineri]